MVLKVQGDVGRCVAINRRSAVNFVHAPYESGITTTSTNRKASKLE